MPLWQRSTSLQRGSGTGVPMPCLTTITAWKQWIWVTKYWKVTRWIEGPFCGPRNLWSTWQIWLWWMRTSCCAEVKHYRRKQLSCKSSAWRIFRSYTKIWSCTITSHFGLMSFWHLLRRATRTGRFAILVSEFWPWHLSDVSANAISRRNYSNQGGGQKLSQVQWVLHRQGGEVHQTSMWPKQKNSVHVAMLCGVPHERPHACGCDQGMERANC